MKEPAKWICDDDFQGNTHKCVFYGTGYCYGEKEKPNCDKRIYNPKWLFFKGKH